MTGPQLLSHCCLYSLAFGVGVHGFLVGRDPDCLPAQFHRHFLQENKQKLNQILEENKQNQVKENKQKSILKENKQNQF